MKHNLGFGTDVLSNLSLTMDLIVFGFHTVYDLVCDFWHSACDRVSTRGAFSTPCRNSTTGATRLRKSLVLHTSVNRAVGTRSSFC